MLFIHTRPLYTNILYIHYAYMHIHTYTMCVHLYGFPLSQGICDGAGAVVLASEDALKQFNLKPLARVAGYSMSGVDPSIMGIGPVSAIRKLLDKTSMKLEDIDLVEVSLCTFPMVIVQSYLQADNSMYQHSADS